MRMPIQERIQELDQLHARRLRGIPDSPGLSPETAALLQLEAGSLQAARTTLEKAFPGVSFDRPEHLVILFHEPTSRWILVQDREGPVDARFFATMGRTLWTSPETIRQRFQKLAAPIQAKEFFTFAYPQVLSDRWSLDELLRAVPVYQAVRRLELEQL